MTSDQQAALDRMDKHVAEMREHLATCDSDLIFAFDYGFGVKISGGIVSPVALHLATPVLPGDQRVIKNGNNEPARLMLRKVALETCIAETVVMRDRVAAQFAADAFEARVTAECVRLAQVNGVDLAEVDRDFVADKLRGE